MSSPTGIHQTWTLADIFRPDRVYNSRNSFREQGLLPVPPGEWDHRQGQIMAIGGGMKMFLPAGYVSDMAEDIVRGAGIPFPRRDTVWTFRSAEEYYELLKRSAPGTVVFDHLHPVDEAPPSLYWIDRSLAGELIDKNRLDRWVPEAFLPERICMERDERSDALRRLLAGGGACVAKASGPVAAGGGYGVVRFEGADELERVLADLPGNGPVVIERYCETRASYCLNFVIPEGSGRPVFIGGPEQIIDAELNFHGNWIGRDSMAGRETVEAGQAAAGRVAAAGYRGILGIDAVVTPDGRTYLIDINPRMNGSTSMAMLYPYLRSLTGPDAVLHNIMILLNLDGDGRLPSCIADAIADRRVIPARLYTFPEHNAYRYKLSGFIAGSSREDVLALQASFTRQGYPAS